jgi:hypothetical protein
MSWRKSGRRTTGPDSPARQDSTNLIFDDILKLTFKVFN